MALGVRAARANWGCAIPDEKISRRASKAMPRTACAGPQLRRATIAEGHHWARSYLLSAREHYWIKPA